MLNVMRISVCVAQSVSSKSITRILSNRIADTVSGQKLFYSSRSNGDVEKPNLENAGVPGKSSRHRTFSPRITVISGDSSLTVMTLEEATKLSNRRGLKLVKVVDVDHKSQRAVYKLMTSAEYLKEDLERRKEKSLRKSSEVKDPKLLTLSSKIADHDLQSKIKNMVKWLNKRHEVRIVIICGGNQETAELICNKIAAGTKSCGKMVQKRQKGDELKFQLVSQRAKEADSGGKSTEESDAVKDNLAES